MVSASEEFGCAFHWPVVVAGGAAALLLLVFFGRLTYRKSAEEELQEAIDLGLSNTEQSEMIGAGSQKPLSA